MGARLIERQSARCCVAAAFALFAFAAQAAVGIVDIEGAGGDGAATLFYPSAAHARPVARGPFTLDVAPNGAPLRSNGRLIVVSHGSGGSPLVHADLARVLVDGGFVVALPEHAGDNYKDMSKVGPESWK